MTKNIRGYTADIPTICIFLTVFFQPWISLFEPCPPWVFTVQSIFFYLAIVLWPWDLFFNRCSRVFLTLVVFFEPWRRCGVRFSTVMERCNWLVNGTCIATLLVADPDTDSSCSGFSHQGITGSIGNREHFLGEPLEQSPSASSLKLGPRGVVQGSNRVIQGYKKDSRLKPKSRVKKHFPLEHLFSWLMERQPWLKHSNDIWTAE